MRAWLLAGVLLISGWQGAAAHVTRGPRRFVCSVAWSQGGLSVGSAPAKLPVCCTDGGGVMASCRDGAVRGGGAAVSENRRATSIFSWGFFGGGARVNSR